MNVLAVQTQALRSPATLFSICLVMVMLVGYLDYISGVENSMLLLYLVPIALATSMRGIPAGIIVSVLSISAWVASDVFAGIVRVKTVQMYFMRAKAKFGVSSGKELLRESLRWHDATRP